FVLDLGIVLRPLVDILDQQHDRCAGRHLLAAFFVGEYAGHDLDRIRLLPLRREPRLSGPPAIKLTLDVFGTQWNPRRAPIDDTADRGPMAFAEARKPEKMAERVERHAVRYPANLGAVKLSWESRASFPAFRHNA